jgi:hypothetical protein
MCSIMLSTSTLAHLRVTVKVINGLLRLNLCSKELVVATVCCSKADHNVMFSSTLMRYTSSTMYYLCSQQDVPAVSQRYTAFATFVLGVFCSAHELLVLAACSCRYHAAIHITGAMQLSTVALQVACAQVVHT